jgi:tRNA modification GTPase
VSSAPASTTTGCRFLRATPAAPGAIAIFQLVGDVVPVLAALTGSSAWPPGRMRLVALGDSDEATAEAIDDAIAGRLTDDVAQVMPHGGPRVAQRVAARLRELGATPVEAGDADPMRLHPEARDRVEALALAAIARAASPLAVDLLLDQPRRWRTPGATADPGRSRRLDRLIDPPVVVLAGPPNVGKSTLSNTLLGRSMSITLDRPGTTRDYTSGRLDLRSLVVSWHDTPGLRVSDDPLEHRAIDIARGLMESADLLIAMTDAEHEWPELPRPADLHLGAKADLAPRDDADLAVSATTGAGLDELTAIIRERLVPAADLTHPGPWKFDDRL